MDNSPLDYRVWRSIEYRPAITELEPDALLPFLAAGQYAMDVGCNTGNTALWLARQGVSVLGIDLNADALEVARLRAAEAGLETLSHFRLADVTSDPLPGPFNMVLLIRLLTCIPSKDIWNTVLHRVFASLCSGGLLYVHDFLRDDEIAHYHQRYHEAESLGWRPGNFAVNDAQGRLLFVAHHHAPEELAQITKPYVQIDLSCHSSRSMNGNECHMFRFLGRKQ